MLAKGERLQTIDGNAGGNWNNASNAGLGYLNSNNERTNSNNNIGFRPALPYMQEATSSRADRHAMEKESSPSAQGAEIIGPSDRRLVAKRTPPNCELK
jgi:hypothetical protein